jgi:hypothetical protein
VGAIDKVNTVLGPGMPHVNLLCVQVPASTTKGHAILYTCYTGHILNSCFMGDFSYMAFNRYSRSGREGLPNINGYGSDKHCFVSSFWFDIESINTKYLGIIISHAITRCYHVNRFSRFLTNKRYYQYCNSPSYELTKSTERH